MTALVDNADASHAVVQINVRGRSKTFEYISLCFLKKKRAMTAEMLRELDRLSVEPLILVNKTNGERLAATHKRFSLHGRRLRFRIAECHPSCLDERLTKWIGRRVVIQAVHAEHSPHPWLESAFEVVWYKGALEAHKTLERSRDLLSDKKFCASFWDAVECDSDARLRSKFAGLSAQQRENFFTLYCHIHTRILKRLRQKGSELSPGRAHELADAIMSGGRVTAADYLSSSSM